MVAGPDDIKELFKLIRQLKEEIDENRAKPLDKKCEKEMIDRFRQVEDLLGAYQEFNDNFIKGQGITEDEIKQGLSPKKRKKSPLNPLLDEADKLRCELLISEAAFIREQFKEFQESNRPFAPASKRVQKKSEKGHKKKLKKKFKKMHERSKWDKI